MTFKIFSFCNADSGGGSSLGSKLKSLSPDSFVRLLQEIFKIVQVMYAWQLMLLVHDYTCKFIYCRSNPLNYLRVGHVLL